MQTLGQTELVFFYFLSAFLFFACRNCRSKMNLKKYSSVLLSGRPIMKSSFLLELLLCFLLLFFILLFMELPLLGLFAFFLLLAVHTFCKSRLIDYEDLLLAFLLNFLINRRKNGAADYWFLIGYHYLYLLQKYYYLIQIVSEIKHLDFENYFQYLQQELVS